MRKAYLRAMDTLQRRECRSDEADLLGVHPNGTALSLRRLPALPGMSRREHTEKLREKSTTELYHLCSRLRMRRKKLEIF